jgi:UDP-glucose 4-epimerase
MPTKNILVVGGAGYIGSHMVDYLLQAGYTPIVLDNLSAGHADAVLSAKLIIGDMADKSLLNAIFAEHSFLAVMHFASFIQVGESVQDPLKYYANNVAATINLLQAMLQWQVNKFIFSSTAAVYGEPQYTPIDENHPLAPINPYGHSKRMVEQMLADFAKAYDLRYMALRYFNAAGAHPEGKLAERHDPETHLIPLILQAANGQRKSITVYGRDYPTLDGTCVRDYIHISDLCAAHLLALEALCAGKECAVYNLGTGQGYSVQQVLDVVREVTQQKFLVVEGERRAGDPAVLVADPRRAMHELQWQPRYSDLRTIVEHAWRADRSAQDCCLEENTTRSNQGSVTDQQDD